MEISRITKDNLNDNDYELLQQYYIDNTSQYYFPNCVVAFYPNIKEQRATKDIICDFNSVIIPKGAIYINYRPLLECLNTKQAFVLQKSIKCDLYYGSILSTNIFELEDLNYKIMCKGLVDNTLSLDRLSDYGELKLLKLNKRKRSNNYENSNSK